MRNAKYKSASVERKLEILGYAHNQGMGGAETWMNTGQVGSDGFGTKGLAISFIASAEDKEILKQVENFKVDEIPSNLIEEEVKVLAQGMSEEDAKKNRKNFEATAKKRITKQYIQEVVTYGINEAKWKAAIEYCKDKNWKFKVITERNLGI